MIHATISVASHIASSLARRVLSRWNIVIDFHFLFSFLLVETFKYYSDRYYIAQGAQEINNMTKEYLKQQAEQKARDRQRAIDIAIERLDEAVAEFKLEIIQVYVNYNAFEDPNFVYITERANNVNHVSADPTAAQYA
jgi:hypothetical protein